MSSNSRITCSKGLSDGTSLHPYTRPRKDTNTKAENTGSMSAPAQQQAEGPGDQLNGTVGHSPFARPGSRAGASTAPTTPMEVPSASISPFTRPGSRAGSAQPDINSPRVALSATRFPNAPSSPVSSISGSMFQEDLNTSTSWDLIDPDCDAEVADITKDKHSHKVNQVVNASIDSTQAKPDRGLEQVSNISLNQNLGTLYNQDFFIADTTGRRMSQIPHKLNYLYPLPNRHSALQLRLPDLLIYLKTDTYLIDVNTGHHYAVYNDRIKRCRFHPSFIQPGDTGNCYKQFKMMPYNLVSTHHSLRPVKYPKAYRQHQDRVNHLLWLSICSRHLPPVDPPLSNMNHHHSALNNLCRCSHGTNAIRYCRTTLQPPILLSIRFLFLNA